MFKDRLLGEPSAAESCLMPNSSDESDEGPSETSSQAKRRRIEAAQYQVDQGQVRIAEMALQEYVDDVIDDFEGQADSTQTNMPTSRLCLKKRASTSWQGWCFRC